MKSTGAFQKIVSIFLTICLVMGTSWGLGLPVLALDAGELLGERDGLNYASLGNSNAIVVGYNSASLGANVNIPSTVAFTDGTYNVTEIHDAVFSGALLTGVSLPGSLLKIGEDAFQGSQLRNITIPGSVQSIGYQAFADCPNLTGASFETGVTIVGNAMFSDCAKLSSISFSDTVQEIGQTAFAGCIKLDTVTIPASVETIRQNAFENCSNLSSLSLSEGLLTIESGAFSGSMLVTSAIPNTVTAIGDSAFSNCRALTNVTIGDGVKSIGNYAFANCSALVGVAIGAAVEDIGEFAFYSTRLSGAVLPTSLKRLGQYSFSKTQLSSILVPQSVTAMGEGAFAYNSNLSSIRVDAANTAYKSVDNFLYTATGETLVLAPTRVTEFAIPASLKTIGACAFAGHTDLTSITFGEAVETVGTEAFAETGLLSVILPDSVKSIGSNAFYNCVSMTKASLGQQVESIGDGAFSTTGVSRVDIPASVTAVGFKAFAACSNLSDIYFFGRLPATFGDASRDIFTSCAPVLTLYCPLGDESWDNFSYPGVTNVARFGLQQEYMTTITVEGLGSATATPQWAQSGATVTLTAQPYAGAQFSSWKIMSGAVTDIVIDRAQTSFTMPGSDVTIKAVFVPTDTRIIGGGGSGGGGSSSGSSGGSGSGGSSLVSTASMNTTQAAVLSVTQAAATAKAAAQTAKNAGAATAVVQLQNIGLISQECFGAMLQAAGMPIKIQVDSLHANNKAVDVRCTLAVTQTTGTLQLAASTTSGAALQLQSSFAGWFQNAKAVIRCEQQNSFGQSVELATKLNLSGVDTTKLTFYSYNTTTHTYVQILQPAYTIDKNGYLHFTTTLAGAIVIAEGPLVKK